MLTPTFDGSFISHVVFICHGGSCGERPPGFGHSLLRGARLSVREAKSKTFRSFDKSDQNLDYNCDEVPIQNPWTLTCTLICHGHCAK